MKLLCWIIGHKPVLCKGCQDWVEQDEENFTVCMDTHCGRCEKKLPGEVVTVLPRAKKKLDL